MKKYTKKIKLYWPSRAKKEFDVLKEPIRPKRMRRLFFFWGRTHWECDEVRNQRRRINYRAGHLARRIGFFNHPPVSPTVNRDRKKIEIENSDTEIRMKQEIKNVRM
jgi:hypothetical protein